MIRKDKQLVVVGDRVLVRVAEEDQRTKVGLYLPPTAIDTQQVQGGDIVSTGPGLALPDAGGGEPSEESWRTPSTTRDARYVPMQARVGDYALFFRKAAIEITFDGEQYLVVPQSALLALVRDREDDYPDY